MFNKDELIVQLKRENSVLRKIAFTDELTGLQNRNAYEYKQSTYEKNDNILVISIDLNYLKKINDNYGHQIGDEYIIGLANILRTIFRKEDIYRIGGDEFAIMVKNIPTRAAIRFYEELKMHNDIVEISNGETIKYSFGAVYSDRNLPLNDLYKTADARMYRMKEKLHAIRVA